MTPNEAPVSKDQNVEELAKEIEQTRAGIGATIQALEHRMGPAELGEKAKIELDHVEARVKAAVKDGLGDAKSVLEGQIQVAKGILEQQIQVAKAAVHDEILVAQVAVREQIHEAKEMATHGLSVARDTIKKDIQAALANTKQSIRDATIGRVEDMATQTGDFMNTTRDTLIDTIRQNPVPAAIAGVGIAWLLMNRSTSHRHQTGASGAMGGSSPAGHAGSEWISGRQSGNREGGGASEGVSRALGDAAGHAVHRAGDVLSGAGAAVSAAGHHATAAARSAVDHGIDAASELGQGAGRLLH